jgi:hypothetical protein
MMKDFLGGIEFLVKEAKKLVGENKGEKQKGLLRQTKSEENPKTDLMPLKKSAEKPAARKVMKKDNGKLYDLHFIPIFKNNEIKIRQNN